MNFVEYASLQQAKAKLEQALSLTKEGTYLYTSISSLIFELEFTLADYELNH